MKKLTYSNLKDTIMFLYILSLYLFTYKAGLNSISNGLAFVLIAVIWFEIIKGSKVLVVNNLIFSFLLFVLMCTFSYFIALNPSLVLSKVTTLMQLFLLLITMVNYITSRCKLLKLMKFYVWAGFIASLYVLMSSDFSVVQRFGRSIGNQNSVGIIISLSIIFGLYLMLNSRYKLFLFQLPFMLSVVLLTGSRKALIFLVFNCMIVLYAKSGASLLNKIKIFLIIGCLLIAGYFLVFKVPIFYEIIGQRIENVLEFSSETGTEEDSINNRADMIFQGLKFFQESPIYGYGIDNFRVLYSKIPGGGMTYSHNNFIELLVGVGLFGTVIYYLCYFSVIAELLFGKCNLEDKHLKSVFLFVVISYFFMGMAMVNYDGKHLLSILAVASVVPSLIKKK